MNTELDRLDHIHKPRKTQQFYASDTLTV